MALFSYSTSFHRRSHDCLWSASWPVALFRIYPGWLSWYANRRQNPRCNPEKMAWATCLTWIPVRFFECYKGLLQLQRIRNKDQLTPAGGNAIAPSGRHWLGVEAISFGWDKLVIPAIFQIKSNQRGRSMHNSGHPKKYRTQDRLVDVDHQIDNSHKLQGDSRQTWWPSQLPWSLRVLSN